MASAALITRFTKNARAARPEIPKDTGSRADFSLPFGRTSGNSTPSTRLGGIRLSGALNSIKHDNQSSVLSRIESTSASVGSKDTNFNHPADWNSTTNLPGSAYRGPPSFRESSTFTSLPGRPTQDLFAPGRFSESHFAPHGRTANARNDTSGLMQNATTNTISTGLPSASQSTTGQQSGSIETSGNISSKGKGLLGSSSQRAGLGAFVLANTALKSGMGIAQQKQQQQYQTGLINRATTYMSKNGIPWLPGSPGISTSQNSAKNSMTAHGTTQPQNFPSGQFSQLYGVSDIL